MDQISNLIINIKNAGLARKDSTSVPYSKLKHSIADVLKSEGYIKDAEERSEKGKKVLKIDLLVENRVSRVKGVQRISKPSKRVYKKSTEMRAVKNGYGSLIVSTSAGVMTGKKAKAAKLGGEALFAIW
ncbi:30S ribosomal protein S8 [Candidatus Parcubacteria bacterium]|nr:30S ribosomal protein S8 [Candidatus Parcubacteria bacterium]